MSRIAQEMQRYADEMAKRRPKKGRQRVEDLEDVTAAADTEQPRSADAPPQAAAAAEGETMAKAKKAKTASAQRSAAWRAKQKKKTAQKVNIRAKGASKWVFVNTTVATAQRAFKLLLADMQSGGTAAPEEGVAQVQRIVERLSA